MIKLYVLYGSCGKYFDHILMFLLILFSSSTKNSSFAVQRKIEIGNLLELERELFPRQVELSLHDDDCFAVVILALVHYKMFHYKPSRYKCQKQLKLNISSLINTNFLELRKWKFFELNSSLCHDSCNGMIYRWTSEFFNLLCHRISIPLFAIVKKLGVFLLSFIYAFVENVARETALLGKWIFKALLQLE